MDEQELFDKIKDDAEERVLRNNDGNQDFSLYLDRQVFQKGETIDIVTEKLEFAKPSYIVFVDDEPGKNFGHRCHFLLYDAETGDFDQKVPAKFPHFMIKQPETLELFRTGETIERYKRKKKMRMMLEPAKLSAYAKLAPFPLKFWIQGKRYAILFSGGSNGRHVNDMEFLYRTLVDVYGYDTANIYVLNHDGTLNYNQMSWETPPSDGFGPDGSAWRMDADSRIVGRGNRTDFQAVISDLQSRIQSWDCLLIHTNNHGWYDADEHGGLRDGYLSAYGGLYYASEFASDIATLPTFKNLLVIMEQCASGSFSQPTMDNSTATNTVFQAAVPWHESSAGGWPFDPWAEMWISAMAGVRGDGTTLAVSPDDNLDTLISSWEAYDYALSIDNPVLSESSVDLCKKLFLCRCRTSLKPIKEWKEPKEWKEIKEWKEPKESLEPKQVFEPKQVLDPKQVLEPKQVMDPKQAMDPKQIYEGPGVQLPFEEIFWAYEELEERMERLEEIANNLTPFIQSEERPDIKPKSTRKRKKKDS